MLLIVLVCSLTLAVTGQQVQDDWIDPYDMLNYDASTKTMKKPAETANYPNVPTKRREYTQDSSLDSQTSCERQVVDLQKQIEEQNKKIKYSQQPSCNPVFKRFLSRLLKEIQRVGVPTDSADVFCDAKIKLSQQTMAEIQAFLEGEESWRTGALDNALNQILVNLKPHDREAWKWRFEDTFGVELDTVLKIGLFVLIIVAIICTQLWSKVSWFVQFGRLFAVCFFVSIIWNWFYLYKIAFAEHQSNLAKMDSVYAKCTGIKKIDWSDSLREWYRSAFTLQDDPCKKYYEILFVNPILLVPPTKAISVTFTTFITEPLKYIGEGISEFLRALLKDLPFTLQIPVLMTIVACIMFFIYISVQGAFIHGITAPFRRHRRDPPPARLQHQDHFQEIEYQDHLAGGDAQQPALRRRANDGRLHRNQVRQRRPNRPMEEPVKLAVETLRTAEPRYSEDETDAPIHEQEENLSAESDSENQQETQEEQEGANASTVAANTDQSETKPTEPDSSPSETEPPKKTKNPSKNKLSNDDGASKREAEERPPSQTDVQDLQATSQDRTSPVSRKRVETLGVPVQESSAVSAE